MYQIEVAFQRTRDMVSEFLLILFYLIDCNYRTIKVIKKGTFVFDAMIASIEKCRNVIIDEFASNIKNLMNK